MAIPKEVEGGCKVRSPESVSECFDKIVDMFGECIAIESYPSTRTISYQELQQQSRVVAIQLVKSMIGKVQEERSPTYDNNNVQNASGVVLCVEEGPELAILVMACAYAGLFYVPVELNKTPLQRTSFIANDCGVKTCICWAIDRDKVPTNLDIISVEELFASMNSLSTATKVETQYLKTSSLSTPLYAIYTSGSTGEPKGVMMTHGNLMIYSEMKGSDEAIRQADSSRVLLASAFTFDLCEGDVYTTLLNGATLITAPRSALLHDLRAVLVNTKSTHITLTPSLFSLLDANEEVNNKNGGEARTQVAKGPLSIPCLRSVCLGGEPMSNKLIQTWGTSPSQHHLILRNLYGATEATVHQTRAVIYTDSKPNNIGVPIGYEYANATSSSNFDVALGLNGVGVFLANSWSSSIDSAGVPMQPVFTIIPPPHASSSSSSSLTCPQLSLSEGIEANGSYGRKVIAVSEPGEIIIFGPTVAKGYLHRPEMSSHKFSESARFGGLFRTGDLGQWVVSESCLVNEGSRRLIQEAHLELMGRMEEEGGDSGGGLVKVNGQRVELGEVVSTLESSELVHKAVVFKLPQRKSSMKKDNKTHIASDHGNKADFVEDTEKMGDNLVAMLVLIQEESILDEHTISALMALCELSLPRHMIPRRFGSVKSLADFPLTHSGKIDQRKVAQLVRDEIDHIDDSSKPKSDEINVKFNFCLFSHAIREAPQSELESCVAAVWETVLGLEVDSIGRYDSFLVLGGDSLAALRASRMLALRTTKKQIESEASLSSSVSDTQVSNERGVEAVIGDEQGLVDGEAALLIHGGNMKTADEVEACMFGITMGPLAPCELENHPVLMDYAHFLSKQGIIVLSHEKSGNGNGSEENCDDEVGELETEEGTTSITPTFRALCSAAASGRVGLVNTLVDVELKKNQTTHIEANYVLENTTVLNRQFTPLHAAASSGHINALKVMKILVESPIQSHSSWIHVSTEAGTTPLHLCAARGGVVGREMVCLLLEAGADLLATDADQCTALHLASRIGDAQLVDILLQACSTCALPTSILKKCNDAMACQECACDNDGSVDIEVQEAEMKVSFLESLDRWGRSALHWSILNNYSEVFKVLVSYGANTSSCELSQVFNHLTQISDSSERDSNVERKEGDNASMDENQSSGNTKRAHGSSDPAHVSRKMSSDIDTIKSLISVIQKHKLTCSQEAVSTMEIAVGSIRNLVCTSNLNREGARVHGVIDELVFLINRYYEESKLEEKKFGEQLVKLAVSAVGTLRNMSYGNENNRVAIVGAKGVHALLRLLPSETSKFNQMEGEIRNLTFTTASALCNIAMSTQSHDEILSENNGVALFIIESVLGFVPSNSDESSLSTAQPVQARPHPGLVRLRDSFSHKSVIDNNSALDRDTSKKVLLSSSTRYSSYRVKKYESVFESLKSLLSLIDESLAKWFLLERNQIQDADDEKDTNCIVTIDEDDFSSNFVDLDNMLKEFIQLVKSNNKNRMIAGELGAITTILKPLFAISAEKDKFQRHATVDAIYLRLIECLGCLSYGNDQNKLAIVAQGGVSVMVKLLNVLCAEDMKEDIDKASLPDSREQKCQVTKLSIISVLCNLAMSYETHDEILSFPTILSCIQQLKESTQGFDHPALSRLFNSSDNNQPAEVRS